MLIAQLSDVHLRVGARDHGSAAALAAAVEAVLALSPLPDAVVITGDLAETGAAGEYRRARELLAPLSMPVHVLPGNHDDRAALRAGFGLPGDPAGPLDHAFRVGPVRVILCDTTVPGCDGGALESRQLDWLESQLAIGAPSAVLLAVHHTPLVTGVAAMDELGLEPRSLRELERLLAGYPGVIRVLGGHVHRAAVGTLGGRVVFACPSTHVQLLLDFDAGSLLEAPGEPPGFALHLISDETVTTHVLPVARSRRD